MSKPLLDEVLSHLSQDSRKRAPSRNEIYDFVLEAVDVLTEQIREQKKRIDQLEKVNKDMKRNAKK